MCIYAAIAKAAVCGCGGGATAEKETCRNRRGVSTEGDLRSNRDEAIYMHVYSYVCVYIYTYIYMNMYMYPAIGAM